LIIACRNNNGDAVLLYQVGDCRLESLLPLTRLQTHAIAVWPHVGHLSHHSERKLGDPGDVGAQLSSHAAWHLKLELECCMQAKQVR